jgi:hypothetical protein
VQRKPPDPGCKFVTKTEVFLFLAGNLQCLTFVDSTLSSGYLRMTCVLLWSRAPFSVLSQRLKAVLQSISCQLWELRGKLREGVRYAQTSSGIQ